jgi:ribosome biogenesis GTPase
MASKKRKKNPIELLQEERETRKLRKSNPRIDQQKPPRERRWNDDAEATVERVMPKGERDRRKQAEANVRISLDDDLLQGVVLEAGNGVYRVEADGVIWLCRRRGTMQANSDGFTNALTVGDSVGITPTGEDSAVIEAVLPRRNYIARSDPALPHLQQLLAANVDQLLIVQAWRDPQIWYELIDRYLVTAQRHDITPLICVNKVDLVTDSAQLDAELASYSVLGIEVLLTSVTDGTGIDALHVRLAGKITVVAGLSGVGKSSLISALAPEIAQATGETNHERGQGRHTTTQAVMKPFAGGYVMDTPGIREFGVSGLHPAELIAYYPDLADFSARCRFKNCTHAHEPDCAVRQAADAGEISATRLKSYQVIVAELSD